MSRVHEARSSTTPLPPLSTETGVIDEDESYWSFRSGLACIRLEIQHADIESTAFGSEYLRHVGGRGSEVTNMDACGKLAKAECRNLTFESELLSMKQCTIAELCRCPQYSLRLVKGEGPRGVILQTVQEVKLGPISLIQALPITDLPDACEGLPCTSVDRMSLTPTNDRCLDGKTTLIGEGNHTYWFKPREDTRTDDFDREITLLSRVRKGQLAGRFMRVVRLHSLVTVELEEGPTQCIGMLLHFIQTGACGGQIGEPQVWGHKTHHTRWQSQVKSTVRELHADDIVWGDVNLGNVIIDENLEAWILDFGGENNVEFVDDENAETKEGDWQGIHTLFDVWLPSRFDGSAQFSYSGDDAEELYRPAPFDISMIG